jgi:hypothetical protein
MYVLDTNILIYFFKGLGNVKQNLLAKPPKDIGGKGGKGTVKKIPLEQLLKLSVEEIFKKLDLNLSLNRVLQNMGLASGDHLTLAGLLLFADTPQSFRPVLNIQCASFLGNDISGPKPDYSLHRSVHFTLFRVGKRYIEGYKPLQGYPL